MPKIYVAFRTSDDHDGYEQPPRLVSGSMTILKTRMKESCTIKVKKETRVLPTTFLVATYNFKPSVPNICQLVEDIQEFEAEDSTNFKVTESGQVRKTGDD